MLENCSEHRIHFIRNTNQGRLSLLHYHIFAGELTFRFVRGGKTNEIRGFLAENHSSPYCLKGDVKGAVFERRLTANVAK